MIEVYFKVVTSLKENEIVISANKEMVEKLKKKHIIFKKNHEDTA